MEETAVIKKKVNDGLYRVAIQTDLKNCHSCHMGKKCCSNNSEMLVRSSLELKRGDLVLIEIEEKSELLRAVFVFLMPMILGGFAACLSYFLFFPKSAGWCFGFFIVIMILTFFISGKMEEKMKRFFPVIVYKINDGSI